MFSKFCCLCLILTSTVFAQESANEKELSPFMKEQRQLHSSLVGERSSLLEISLVSQFTLVDQRPDNQIGDQLRFSPSIGFNDYQVEGYESGTVFREGFIGQIGFRHSSFREDNNNSNDLFGIYVKVDGSKRWQYGRGFSGYFGVDGNIDASYNFKDRRSGMKDPSGFVVMDVGYVGGASLDLGTLEKEAYIHIGACADLRGNWFESTGLDAELYAGGSAKFVCEFDSKLAHKLTGEVKFMHGLNIDREYFDTKFAYTSGRYDVCLGYTNDSLRFNQLEDENLVYISFGITLGPKCNRN